MRAALSAPAGAVILALASACGGGDGGTTAVSPGEPARPLPACARAVSADPAPPDLPADFPLPPGTAITSANSPHPSQLVIVGVIPADLQEASAFFSEALPRQGYQVGVGDAEGTESEAPFTGNGYRGKWRVNEIPDCPALKLTLVLIEQS